MGQTIKQLHDAGVQIELTAERAKVIRCTALNPLLKIVDQDPAAESTVDESQAENEDVHDVIAQSEDEFEATSENWESESFDEEMEDALEGMDTRLANIVKKKVQTEKESIGLRGRFIDLVDVLPALPQKGDFLVEDIKSSPYFFS
jgi:DNA-directed RNA polymerase